MRLTPNLLAVNTGSTTTKFGLYRDAEPLLVRTLQHNKTQLESCGSGVLGQVQYRLECLESELEACGMRLDCIEAVVGQGGLLRGVTGGTYHVNDEMLKELRRAERGQDAANLGAFLASAIASRIGVSAYVVDPISVDEWNKIAKFSGLALINRPSISHALNTRAMASCYAKEAGKRYEDLRLIVAHLGCTHSISAHADGHMIDSTNSREEGAFSGERSGALPVRELVKLCFSGQFTQKEIEHKLMHEAGLVSYLGTDDVREVEKRIANGDEYADLVFQAMAYQITKEIGAMACVLQGKVDGIVLTGGMTFSERLTKTISDAVRWIAPIKVYPGEDELSALVEGYLKVKRHEAPSHEFGQEVPEAMTL